MNELLASPFDRMRLSWPKLVHVVNFSLSHRYIYVETPKVACTSIKRNLQLIELDGRHDLLPEDVHPRSTSPLLRIDERQDAFAALLADPSAFTFCFVRNPFTRVLSCYLDKFGHDRRQAMYRRLIGCAPDADVSFADFLERIADQPDVSKNLHWAPQSFILQNDTIRYDFIGRFENFDHDLAYCLSRITKRHYVPRTFAPHATHAAKRQGEYFGTREIELIRQIYARDFETLGYGWDPVRLPFNAS